MTHEPWPDRLQTAEPARIQSLLERFWQTLAMLPDLVQHAEHLLCAQRIATARDVVTEMMLALNGIAWPTDTCRLNSYLGEGQRAAIQKTLLAPAVDGNTWVGQAVSLLVIFRWYAPQLVQKYGLAYPLQAEQETLAILERQLPQWPLNVLTN